MQRLSRSLTATPLGTVLDLGPETNESWAQGELSSYFKQHPEKLTLQLDRIMDKLRQCQGDMQPFITELDGMIDALNTDIDFERRDVAGRSRLMRDYPNVTNEFLHFFLDGIMEAMEQEQAGTGTAEGWMQGSTASGGSGTASGRSSGLIGLGATGSRRPASSGSASKERFSSVSKRMPV